MRNTILCMFSGGIDSTGVLHQLFGDPSYRSNPLIVHHIVLQNRENRARAEIQAVQKILEYYREHCAMREFIYTESIFNSTGFAPLQASRFPFDMDVCAFTAANICVARKDVKQVAMGRTRTDIDSGGHDFAKRMQRAQGIFKAVYALEQESLPDYIFPVMEQTKQEIWESLPTDVREAAWYCRHPQYDQGGKARACKRCQTCKEVQSFLELSA